MVTIEVADTGIGVPEADRELVFRELGRAANAQGLPGSGLGLSLVRTIAQRHGGTVRMASRVGSSMPMHSTAVGKAYLAALDEALTDLGANAGNLLESLDKELTA